MTLCTLVDVVRSFAAEPVLDGLSLRVDEGDRIGVVGDNGAGKTTMVRILAGADEPDRGQRNPRADLRVAYGEQMPKIAPGTTVLDYVLRGNGAHHELEAQIRALEQRLAAVPDDPIALERYGHLQAAFEAGGGYQRAAQVEKVLDGLGFPAADRQKDCAVLSGGERSRAQLAALMTTPADLLILDEPTNHLDLDGIAFVEDFVQRYRGAVVIVSHDRSFLDRAVTSIVEVGDGVARRYKGNYAAFKKQKELELLTLQRQFKSQQEFFEKEMDYIRRNMAGQNSSQAKGRLKRLQRLQLLERPSESRAEFRLRFQGGRGQQGQTVLEGEDLTLRLPDGRELLRDATVKIQFGETVALLGRNGAGKTTLLKALAGVTPFAQGGIRRAHNLRIGYFSQDKADLPRHGTVLDALRALDRTIDEKELRDHLALFLFCGEDVDKPVAELSGGEKQRLSLALMLRAQFDLLCLDEPTNHLDVQGTETLEQALKEFPGTVLLITHDRTLVREVADRVLWMEDGGLRSFERGLDHCLQTLAAERSAARAEESAVREREQQKAAQAAAPAPKAMQTGKVRNPLLFERLEQRIFGLEEELERLRAAMLQPENYGSGSRMKELQGEETRVKAELARAYQEWENWS